MVLIVCSLQTKWHKYVNWTLKVPVTAGAGNFFSRGNKGLNFIWTVYLIFSKKKKKKKEIIRISPTTILIGTLRVKLPQSVFFFIKK